MSQIINPNLKRIYIVLMSNSRILLKPSDDGEALTLMSCSTNMQELKQFFIEELEFPFQSNWFVIDNSFKTKTYGEIHEQFLVYRLSDEHLMSLYGAKELMATYTHTFPGLTNLAPVTKRLAKKFPMVLKHF